MERPSLAQVVVEAKRTAIRDALRDAGGSVQEAARLLQMNRTALYYLMARLGMSVSGLRLPRPPRVKSRLPAYMKDTKWPANRGST